MALRQGEARLGERRLAAERWLDERAPLLAPPGRLAEQVQRRLGPGEALLASGRPGGRPPPPRSFFSFFSLWLWCERVSVMINY